jgi:hypothetical protein
MHELNRKDARGRGPNLRPSDVHHDHHDVDGADVVTGDDDADDDGVLVTCFCARADLPFSACDAAPADS